MQNYTTPRVASEIERDDADTQRHFKQYLKRKANKELRQEMNELLPWALTLALFVVLLAIVTNPAIN